MGVTPEANVIEEQPCYSGRSSATVAVINGSGNKSAVMLNSCVGTAKAARS